MNRNKAKNLPNIESRPISLGNVPVILVSKNQNVAGVEGYVKQMCQYDTSSFISAFQYIEPSKALRT